MGTKNLNSATDMITFTRASGGTALRKISYGTELVTNGTFDSNTNDWTASNSTLSVDSNKLKVTSTGNFGHAEQDITTVSGKVYLVTGNYIAGDIDGYVQIEDINGGGTIYSDFSNYYQTDKTVSVFFTAVSNSTRIALYNRYGSSGNFNFWDNVSVKEVLYDQADGTLQLYNHLANIPRIEYDAAGAVKGLLIEEARTNLLPLSNNFSSNQYFKSNISLTASSVTSPDGSNNGWKITPTATNAYIRRGGRITGDLTHTMYVKKDTADYVVLGHGAGSKGFLINFSFASGTVVDTYAYGSNTTYINSSVENVDNGWYRISITGNSDASNSLVIFPWDSATGPTNLDSSSNTSLSTLYIYGAQTEAGAFPTSYIPTTGATATRAADVASIPVDNFGYNDDAGTVVVDYDTPNIQVSDRLLSLSTEFTNRVFDISLPGTNLINYSDASGQINLGSLTSTGKVAVAFKSAKEFVGGKDGAVITVDPTTTAVTRPETLYIGTWATTSDRFPNGHIKSIKYYPRRLSNTQLQELTT